MLDGVFHADLQGRPDDPAGVRLGWDALLAIMGGEPPRRRASAATRSLRPLTLDPEQPDLGRLPASRAPARARAPSATSSPAEMWEAINTIHLGLLQRDDLERRRADRARTRVYAYVKERCALFWGLTGAHDAARRGARVPATPAGASSPPTWSCGCCASRCPLGGEDAEAHLRDGQALALLQAVGGFQAYRRAVPAPPNAGPVARFLLFERAYPDSVAASVDAAARRAGRRRRRARAAPRRCCASAA